MLSTRGYPERDGDGEGLGLKYSSSWMIYVHNIHTNIHNIHNIHHGQDWVGPADKPAGPGESVRLSQDLPR